MSCGCPTYTSEFDASRHLRGKLTGRPDIVDTGRANYEVGHVERRSQAKASASPMLHVPRHRSLHLPAAANSGRPAPATATRGGVSAPADRHVSLPRSQPRETGRSDRILDRLLWAKRDAPCFKIKRRRTRPNLGPSQRLV